MMDKQSQDDRVYKAIEKIGSVGSKAIGAALGALVTKESGMPMAGAVVSVYLSEQLKDVYSIAIGGKFGERKIKRAGDAAIAIASGVTTHREAGLSMRTDDFFVRNDDGRSSADEVLEAALDAAMSAFEEQKITFITNITTSICFDTTLDPALAQMLISTLRRLSLRAIMILAACDNAEALTLQDRPRIGTESSPATEALFSEYFSLVTLNLVQRIDTVGGHVIDVLSNNGVDPAQMRATRLGQRLCTLAKLRDAQSLPAWQDFLAVVREAAVVGTAGHSVGTGVYDGRAAAKQNESIEEQKRDVDFSKTMSILNM